MAHNYQFQSVTFYISKTVDIWSSRFLVHSCKIISPGVFLYFSKKKIQYCEYFNSYIFHWPTSTAFLINSCFSSSSTNAKQEFWGVSHLLHMCVIFCHFRLFFTLLPSWQPKKSKFWKNEKSTWRYYHLTNVCHK